MVRRALICLTFLALASSPGRGGDEGIEITVEDLGLIAPDSVSITRRTARAVLGEARKAFATIANDLGTSSGRIFAVSGDRPPWVMWSERREARIWIRLDEAAHAADTGSERYRERMERGDFTIYLPAPAAEDLSPDDLHLIWREMAGAILSHANWVTTPPWLREGLAEYYGARAAEGGHSLLPALRDELKKRPADAPVREILATADATGFERAGGRAVSFAIVTLLMETDERLVVGLVNQSRLLLEHLVLFRDSREVATEFAGIVLDQLSALDVSDAVLARAVAAWVAEDFPEGSNFRRSAARKLLKVRTLPEPFGVALSGRFGTRTHLTDDLGVFHTYQPFEGGTVVWRLPWPAALELFVGVCGRPGTSYGLRPDLRKDGYFLTYPPLQEAASGRLSVESRTLDLPEQTTKQGVLWCAVTSPRGLGFRYRQDYKLK